MGLNSGISGIDYKSDVYSALRFDPAQVDTQMAAIKSTVQNGADKLNKFIDQALSGR